MTKAIESADRAPESNVAAEDVAPKELVVDTVGTGTQLADGTSSWDGIAMRPAHGDWIHDHEYDTDALEYLASENDRVPYGGYEDGAVIRPLTILDSGSGESSPTVSENTVVGIPDTTVTDAEPDWAGRIVEEGYSADTDSDGTANATTFSRANGNFIPVGTVTNMDGETVSAFDTEVRVKVDKSL